MEAPVPSPEALIALPTDDWSALLAVALPTLRGLPDDERDGVVERLVTTPPARLVAGRPREQLTAVVRRPGVWSAVAAGLDDRVLAVLGDPDASPGVGADVDRAIEEERARAENAAREAAAAAERAAGLRERLEEARRTATGATARVAALEEQLLVLRTERDEARAAVEELRASLEGAAAARERAVERERRRAAARDDRDRGALREARRSIGALEEEVAGLRRQLEAARRATQAAPPAAVPTRPDDDFAGGRRGRPSVLPAGFAAGTRETASWLVAAGVSLLVDGYNVTRTHRPGLAFEQQRRWLEDAVAALATRRRIPATIVWDSGVGASSHRSRTGVTVRFTAPEMTADDELVLHVRTLLEPDEPVVVVTDDAELRGRLGALGVDLLDTTSFTWLLR